MVKVYQKDKRPDAGEGTEESDCEDTPESADASSPEAQVNEEEVKGAESLPVLTLGSFARYARKSIARGLRFLTFSTAGDPCFSTCARTIYSLHP